MSEPKLISPLLDGYAMGNPMSEHDGVRCCPAMKENTDKKYIVKIISIPASQVQLDALLFTGAYKEPAAAMDYFRELADGVVKEAECLKKLAKLEGFLPYDNWQIVPMEDNRLGYEVYLISSYKRSLEKHMRRNTMTHLGAVNLGLDMCDALAAARRAGWIYADLKPSNIFISENKEYRIGDLGFLALDSLKYASLPSKYRSAYTAPELHDDLVTPNETIDTYAIGMILYQIFNDGVIPVMKHPTEDVLPAPSNADYEMAEIILKACAPDPKDRWADPIAMGQALVAYMQRNSVNDTPIMPPLAPVAEETVLPGKPLMDETLPGMNNDHELGEENLSAEMAEMITQADDLISHEPPAPAVAPEGTSVEELEADILESAEDEKKAEESAAEETADVPSEEASETPAEAPAEAAVAVAVETEEKNDPADYSDLDDKRKKAKRKAWTVPIIIVLILGLLAGAGYWYYTNEYLLMVDELTVEGAENQMTVILDTEIDETLLTVICTDTYGNTKQSPVADGKAEFTELLPDMLYKVRVEVEGFHKLDGSTTHEYMTPAQTKIASFTAATGSEDGSVILNFTVDGPDSEEWTVVYGTDGEEPMEQTFTGHMATVNGLTVGKTYSFQLIPVTELYLTGENSLEFTAASIIVAEKLQVAADANGNLVVTWSAPEGTVVESWDVHCYSVDGYDKRFTTSDLTATFDEIVTGSAYTVEVTAAGMTQPARANVTANPLSITAVNVNADDVMTLNVSWEFEGNAPTDGWLLMYTIDGSTRQEVVQCESNSGVIEIRVPGATYDLSIQAADGSTVFNNSYSYKAPNAEIYENAAQAFYPNHQSEYFFVNLLETPEKENWTHSDVSKSDYTNTFKQGEGISVLFYFMHDFYLYHENISVMYVIRDAEGKVQADLIGRENLDWQDDMWRGNNYHYCGLDVPAVPTTPGEYSLYVYFNGYAVTTVDFTITE